jgi:hypothetical protein
VYVCFTWWHSRQGRLDVTIVSAFATSVSPASSATHDAQSGSSKIGFRISPSGVV